MAFTAVKCTIHSYTISSLWFLRFACRFVYYASVKFYTCTLFCYWSFLCFAFKITFSITQAITVFIASFIITNLITSDLTGLYFHTNKSYNTPRETFNSTCFYLNLQENTDATIYRFLIIFVCVWLYKMVV